MKRTVCILICMSLSMLSYGQQQRQPLTGVWGIDLKAQIKEMHKQEGQQLGSLPDLVQEQVKASLSSRKFIFKADGHFEAYWLLGGTSQLVSGEWEMNGPDFLLIKSNGQQDKEYKLYRKGNQLKMVPSRPLGNLVETLYLIKEAP